MDNSKLRSLFSKLTDLFKDFNVLEVEGAALLYDGSFENGTTVYSSADNKFGPAVDGEYRTATHSFKVVDGVVADYAEIQPEVEVKEEPAEQEASPEVAEQPVENQDSEPAKEEMATVFNPGLKPVDPNSNDETVTAVAPTSVTDDSGAIQNGALTSGTDAIATSSVPDTAINAPAPVVEVETAPEIEPVEDSPEPNEVNKKNPIEGLINGIVESILPMISEAISNQMAGQIQSAIQEALGPVLQRVGSLEGLAGQAPAPTELKNFSAVGDEKKSNFQKANDFWDNVGSIY